MSDHLPECPCTALGVPSCICDDSEECGPQCRHNCICDRLRACEARVREHQRASDYATLWARIMLEDGKYRAALVRAAIIIRGRLTDRDVLRLTGHVVSLHQWKTAKPPPGEYDRGYRDGYNAHAAAQQRALIEYGGRPYVSREAPGGS